MSDRYAEVGAANNHWNCRFWLPALHGILLLGALIGWWTHPPVEFSTWMPDSGSYARFDATRGTGYPALLDMYEVISGEVVDNKIQSSSWLFAVQLLMMGLMFSWLAHEVAALTKFSGWQSLVMIATLFNPSLMRYAFTVLSEAFFISAVAAWLAASLHLIRRPQALWLMGALAAFFFAWAWLIKPLALVWLPVFGLLLLWWVVFSKSSERTCFRNRATQHATWLLMIASIIMAITTVGKAYREVAVNNPDQAPFFGGQLLGKMAFVPAEPAQTSMPDAVTKVNDLLHSAREARRSMPGWNEKFLFSENFYDYLRFTHRKTLFPQAEQPQNAPQAQRDPAKSLAIALLKANPVAYFQEWAMTSWALWTFAELQTRSSASQYVTQLDEMEASLPLDIQNKLYRPTGRSPLVVWSIKAFMLWTCLVSVVVLVVFSIALLMRRWQGVMQDSMFIGLVFAALAAHAYVVGMALFQTALLRYVMGVWPVLITIAALGATLSVGYLWRDGVKRNLPENQ